MRHASRQKQETLGFALFMAPALLLFAAFFLYPVVSILVTSFTTWNGISPPRFTALDNYRFILTDSVFWRSLKNNLLWVTAAVFVQVPLAALAAMILAGKPKGWKVFRTVYFLPQVISGAAIAMLWFSVYNSDYGILNKALQSLGLGNFARNWLGDLRTAFPACLVYWVLYIGYFMMIILSDIITIPKSYYEAASIDGASAAKAALHITLPMIIPASLGASVTLALVYGLRQFEQVFILTGGGPANRTSLLVIYLYQQMKNNAYGLSGAAGIMLILLGAALIGLSRRLFQRMEEE